MTEQAELAISRREAMGKAAKRLRKAGLIPANIYGHHEASQAIQLDAMDFDALRRAHKITSILKLRMSDGSGMETALVRHVKRDPVTLKIQHIDFFRVSLTERIEVKVALHYVGDVPAVKNENGMLLHLEEALDVECVAQDIVDFIDVDVTSLEHIGDSLFAKDVTLPSGYTLITEADKPIVKIVATRGEEVQEAAEEKAEAAPAAGEAASAEEAPAEE